MKPRWTDKLTRVIRDAQDDIRIKTRKDAREYMAALPDKRALRPQWQIAAKELLEGKDAERVTRAIEMALMYEARLDCRLASARIAP